VRSLRSAVTSGLPCFVREMLAGYDILGHFKPSKSRAVVAVARSATLGGVDLLLMLRRFEHNQVYHPDPILDRTGAELGRPFEDAYFRASDGVELNGWFFPANENSARDSLAILYCHGNAGNISHRLKMCETLLSTGVSVFAFDYRGYGRSQGRPSEAGTYRDALAAQKWLMRKGFTAGDILVYGESLGGGVGSELALRTTTGGLILQNSFTSIPDIGAELFPFLPVRWLAKIRYDTVGKLPMIRVPVLVMHSRGDLLINFRHAERNFAAANEPKLFCELKGGHNEPLTDQKEFIGGLEKFLNLVENRTGQGVKRAI
jgi:fermentation-respiration switch protein FrsA (DUF1100 family)